MYIYILLFIITAVIAIRQFEKRGKVSPYVFGLYVLSVGAFVGISDMLGGYDRYIYAEVFTAISNSVSRGEGILNEAFLRFFSKEPAYGLTNVLIGLITPNRYIFIFIYTLLMYAIYGICFYRYTEKPYFALLIFMSLMFFFTFTYLRQVLAAGIVWLSLPYYTQRKKWKYLAIIALATMTHNSAIIMVVLYFIPLRKWKFSQIMLVMIMLLGLGLVGVGGMFTFAGDMTGFENFSDHAGSAEAGFRYEYVLESFVFLFLLYQNYQLIKKNKESLSYLNLYLMFCGILLFFCKSGDGGRISWYGVMGLIFILTQICKLQSRIGLRLFLTIMLFGLFFRVLDAWEFNMCPYKTFFTPGHTGSEWIYEKYEYDTNYDVNKFYNL